MNESEYKKKEKEWHKLVGKKRFESLNKIHRDFLIKGAGCLDLGFPIDIKKAYKYPLYENDVK